MTTRRRPQIASRKQPQQARSTELVAAILEAAAQVLAREGATRFTTARVAEKAGVSVGSIYQYFPNKASILFRLQVDEWMQTTRMLRNILEDASASCPERLRTLVHAFWWRRSEIRPVRRSESDPPEGRSFYVRSLWALSGPWRGGVIGRSSGRARRPATDARAVSPARGACASDSSCPWS